MYCIIYKYIIHTYSMRTLLTLIQHDIGITKPSRTKPCPYNSGYVLSIMKSFIKDASTTFSTHCASDFPGGPVDDKIALVLSIQIF